MMFGFGSFNLINEFEQISNEPNVEQLASSSARLQSYMYVIAYRILHISIQLDVNPYHKISIKELKFIKFNT